MDDRRGNDGQPPPAPFDDVRPDKSRPVQIVSDFMVGTWAGSFASFVHDDPVDPKPAPQLAAYSRSGTAYAQTDGYFVAATILCLKFQADATIWGKVKINRGGRLVIEQNSVTGNYSWEWNEDFGIIEGAFSTFYPVPDGQIQTNYYFIAKNPNELEWIWLSSTHNSVIHRASITRGTLARVYPLHA